MDKKNKLKTYIDYIKRYFDQTTLGTLKKTYRFLEPGIIWDDNTTLSQVFKYVSSKNPIYRKTIYKLYKFAFSDIINENNKDMIPEGIIELDFNIINKSNYKKLKENCLNSDVYLPKSLKKLLYGDFLNDANILTLYINQDLETFKQNDSNAMISQIQLKEKEYIECIMSKIIVQLPKNIDFMHNNKCINHIVIESNSKFFDNEENVLGLCDYYVSLPTESFSNSFTCYYIGYLHSIPKFKCFSFIVGEHTYVYDPKVIESELSGINWGYGNVDNEYLLNKVCRHMLIMLPDENQNKKTPSLTKKLTYQK